MKRSTLVVPFVVSMAAIASGCATVRPTPERHLAATSAVAALQASRFDEADKLAQAVIAGDAGNPEAHIVAALVRYKAAMHQLRADLMSGGMGLIAGQANHDFIRFAMARAIGEFDKVDADLEVAARVRDLAFEQCIACWQADWNGNNRADDGDQHFLEIELGPDGKEYPPGDPRRRPTYRFDVGDVHWARAMVAFQRAALEIVLAYKWTALDTAVRGMFSGDKPNVIVIKLDDGRRIARARSLILTGLDESDACRKAYLDETDDEREWVPNPRQKNHPMPLEVDERLYETWRLVVGDLRGLVRGEQGIDVAQAAQLGDHGWKNPPRGFIDVGRMLGRPTDIVIDLGKLEAAGDSMTGEKRDRAKAEAVLTALFGEAYVPRMEPTPLLERMSRMHDEVGRGEESFERKLRYLLWLN